VKLVITNHTGARNRGCEALVLSKILGFERYFDDLDFEVLSHDPLYDSWRFREYATSSLSYLTKTPEHSRSILANKMIYKLAKCLEFLPLKKKLGVRFGTQSALSSADVVVPSGGDIFTSDYHNLRKHLSTLLLAKSSSKVYLCSHTIGPIKKNDESYFRKCISRADLISVRESESYAYLKSLNMDLPVFQTADVAFTLPALDKQSSEVLLKSRYGVDPNSSSMVAISVSEGIVKYSSLDRSAYYEEFAKFVDYLNSKGRLGILIPHVMETNPGNNDVIACEEVLSRVRNPEMNRIIFGEPSAIDFKGVIGLCDSLVGTRTHATIASLSQCVPTVSIAYSRKAYGIMRDIFGGDVADNLTVPVKNMTAKQLIGAYECSLENAPNKNVIERVKSKSEENFVLLKKLVNADL